MRLRGERNRSNKSEIETYGIHVIQEQAAHELRYGEPRVSCKFSFYYYKTKTKDISVEANVCHTLYIIL